MRYSIGQNGCGHILMEGKTGGKEGSERGKGGGMYKASCHTGGNMNKKKKNTLSTKKWFGQRLTRTEGGI